MTPRNESAERKAEYLAQMHRQMRPGTTLWTVLRHVSSSGMTRSIDVYTLPGADEKDWWSYRAAAILGESYDERREAVKVGGCGMDMGFQLVYSLSRTLYPDGYGCIGKGCPANDHANGDRDYTKHTKRAPHWHRDGGYALRQRWL
jgi:hypothetical protein